MFQGSMFSWSTKERASTGKTHMPNNANPISLLIGIGSISILGGTERNIHCDVAICVAHMNKVSRVKYWCPPPRFLRLCFWVKGWEPSAWLSQYLTYVCTKRLLSGGLRLIHLHLKCQLWDNVLCPCGLFQLLLPWEFSEKEKETFNLKLIKVIGYSVVCLNLHL